MFSEDFLFSYWKHKFDFPNILTVHIYNMWKLLFSILVIKTSIQVFIPPLPSLSWFFLFLFLLSFKFSFPLLFCYIVSPFHLMRADTKCIFVVSSSIIFCQYFKKYLNHMHHYILMKYHREKAQLLQNRSENIPLSYYPKRIWQGERFKVRYSEELDKDIVPVEIATELFWRNKTY